ncbi:MAG: helix-turn-helix domain-containing protein [Leptospiraceae bacterium]|nr:helix-turn-helix domain-containing protein [Leptospiraceae bacterium]
MGETHQFIKFMTDIIDSGAWANLSAGARTLYPVLLKFSDQNFKHVWPSTSTLMDLTGFKSKKSVIEAKKDLIKSGLIQVVPGNGHTTSRYYFSFNYPGSKITPQWYTNLHPGGSDSHLSGVTAGTRRDGTPGNPNQINITITNNQNQKPDKYSKKKIGEKHSVNQLTNESLIEDYGVEIFSEAYEIAKSKNLEKELRYIKAICKEKAINKSKQINFNHSATPTSISGCSPWESFLDWAKTHLTTGSFGSMLTLKPVIDGKTILIENLESNFLRQVISRYFQDNFQDKILIMFGERSREENRIA